MTGIRQSPPYRQIHRRHKLLHIFILSFRIAHDEHAARSPVAAKAEHDHHL